MKVWCSIDGEGAREMWGGKPIYNRTRGQWHSGGIPDTELVAMEEDFLLLFEAIFPKNIKPGECKQVTIKRWEVDDEGMV